MAVMAVWSSFVLRKYFAKTLDAKTIYSNVSYVCFVSNASFEADTMKNE